MSSQTKSISEQGLHFGEWLRRLRDAKELTLREVAAAAEMDMTHLSKAERGQRLLTEEQTAKLAQFFQVDPKEAQARRMVEKFREEGEGNPEAAREAVCMLAEEAGIYRTESKKGGK